MLALKNKKIHRLLDDFAEFPFDAALRSPSAFAQVFVETDALLVEQALNTRGLDFSKQAHMIEDLKIQMDLWFASCNKVIHCRREANMPAHHLARLGFISP